MQKLITASAVGLVLALGAGAAAANPDWSKAPGKKITVFYPGVSPIEWITKGTEHGGAKGLRKARPVPAATTRKPPTWARRW